ncbi:hypothetical protein [Clostridium rectalis]|nr:hypothetical protein [Clostridium rectalis]
MGNKDVINEVLKIYFKGGNWQGYLKEVVKKEKIISRRNKL